MVGAEAIRDSQGQAPVPEQEDRKEPVNNSNGQQAYAWVMVGMFGHTATFLQPVFPKKLALPLRSNGD
jgi:hypothetical protein